MEAQKLRRFLDDAYGGGRHGLLSMYIHPADSISGAFEELDRAYNRINSPTNKEDALETLTCVKRKFKMYTEVPRNGIFVFSGLMSDENGLVQETYKEFLSIRPTLSTYCSFGYMFKSKILDGLSEYRIGYVVFDSNYVVVGIVVGNTCEVVKSCTRESLGLPRNVDASVFLKKTLRIARAIFFKSTMMSRQRNVDGIVLALEKEAERVGFFHAVVFSHRDEFIRSLQKCVFVSKGGISGLHETINLTDNARIHGEISSLRRFFNHVKEENGLCVYGYDRVEEAMTKGAIDTILVWEDLDFDRDV